MNPNNTGKVNVQIENATCANSDSGSMVFVTSFQLAGVQGMIAESGEKALVEITKLMNDTSVGLILVSDDISKNIGNKLIELRAKKSTPLVFELPASASQKAKSTTGYCSNKS